MIPVPAPPPKPVVLIVSALVVLELVKLVILISSPSSFSNIKCFKSDERFAFTPVLPVKLLILFAKLVKLFVKTEPDIATALFIPCLLSNVNEIIPS